MSVHVYFDGHLYTRECDDILSTLAKRVVEVCTKEALLARWFFIRYAERGNHIRLRLRPTREDDGVVVRAILDNSLSALADRIVRAEYVAYEPELNRYGGRAGVDLAERHFCASSTAAVLALSEFEDAPRATRLGRALAAMLATMHVFFALPDEVAPFAASYARGYFDLVAQQYTSTREWQRQFDAAWQTQAESIGPLVLALWRGLCAGEAISPFLDSYRASLNATQAVFEDLSARGLLDVPNDRPEDAVYLIAARRIVPSYVHMMNNRLGISTAEEALLGRLIAHSIERVASEAA